MTERWFVGVDLAWSDRHESGVAVLRWSGSDLRFVSAEVLTPLEEIAARVRSLPGTLYLAIDAPLIVTNADGRRPVDGILSARYGRFDAGAHPTNLRILHHQIRGGELVRLLSDDGLRIADSTGRARRLDGRWAFETYPHAAMVELFGLDRIFKYKRGAVTTRRAEMERLSRCLCARFPRLDPALPVSADLEALLSVRPQSLRGAALKRHEDTLDGVFCAYLAAHHWYWGDERSRVLGDCQTGVVILPAGEAGAGNDHPRDAGHEL